MTSLKSKKFISMLLVLAMALTLLPATVVFGASYKSVEDFVTNLYVAGLGRQPEEAGLKFWLDELEKGRPAAEVIGFVLLDSEEFNEKFADIPAKEFVKKAYEIVFAREAEEGGLEFWVDEMRKGASQRYVIVSMLQAPTGEFQEFCEEFGIKVGTLPVRDEERPGEEYVDKVAPEFNYKGETKFTVEFGEEFTLPVVTATDNIDGEVDVTRVITNKAGEKIAKIDTTVPGVYTITYSAVDVAGNVNKLVLTVTVEPFRVVEVSAINGNKLKIEFNHPISDVDEVKANSDITGLPSVGGKDFSLEESSFKLQDDNKTVIVTLKDESGNNYVIPNKTTFVVLIQPVESKDDPNLKTEYYTKTLTFNDTVRPAVKEVKYPRAGVAEIIFTEELETAGMVTVLQGTTDVTSTVATGFNEGDSKLVLTVEANKEYTVNIVGAKDWSGNLISPNPTKVIVKSTVKDEVDPEIVSVKATGKDSLEIVFSEALKVISQDTHKKYAVIKINNEELTGGEQEFDTKTNTLKVTRMQTQGEAVEAGIHNVEISGYKDLAGNEGDTWSKAVKFEETAPTLQKVEVKTIRGVKTLVLTFDKNVDVIAAEANVGRIKGTYITPEGIEKNFAEGTITGRDISVSDKELRIDVSNFDAGDYTLVIPAAAISDGTTTLSDDLKVEFTIKAEADTEKAEVVDVFVPGDDASSVGGPDSVPRNEIYVKYDREMGSTAISKANYQIEGAPGAIKSAVFVGDKTLVRLTLEDDTITLNGEYLLIISSNVKGENGVAIDTTRKIIDIKENVRPVLESATLINATTIKVTFSEAMDSETVDANDFKVTINGVVQTIDGVISADNSNKSFNITIEGNGVEDLEKDVVKVELVKGAGATDLNGNPVKTPKIIDVEL